jgi:hypothetical protein
MTPAYRFKRSKPVACLALVAATAAVAALAWRFRADNPVAPAPVVDLTAPLRSPADPGSQVPDDRLAEVDRAPRARGREGAAIEAPSGIQVSHERKVG